MLYLPTKAENKVELAPKKWGKVKARLGWRKVVHSIQPGTKSPRPEKANDLGAEIPAEEQPPGLADAMAEFLLKGCLPAHTFSSSFQLQWEKDGNYQSPNVRGEG